MPILDRTLRDSLAATALANVATQYPFHLAHLARGDADVAPPWAMHPIFHGAYDWHSCVHMHWTLARCLRLDPTGDLASRIAAHFDARFTAEAAAGECAYFSAPGRAAFERPYGWGWLQQLAGELDALATMIPAASRWRDALAPLTALIGSRVAGWLPRADFAVRAGTHGNSAFALILALNHARRSGTTTLAAAIEQRALRWFAGDHAYPADYEPGGDDFLSGGLCEALLMARVLPAIPWRHWWARFVPGEQALAHWLAPVPVSDPTDPKIVHLHGLNLSRVWCWRQLLPILDEPLRGRASEAAEAHLAASLAAATDGDYVGTHWLASFALLALDGESFDRS
jgi:hypothetical protein